MSSLEVSQLIWSLSSQLTCAEKFDLKCYCGLDAKLRVSRTDRNKFRPFYNCSEPDFGDQCKFFQWADELFTSGDKHLDMISGISSECRRLGQRIDIMLREHEIDRAAWDRERMDRRRIIDLTLMEHEIDRAAWHRERTDIMSRLDSAIAELDEMKARVKKLDDSDSIPFYDDRVCSDDNEDDARVIQAVETQ